MVVIRKVEDIVAWQSARDLARQIYTLPKTHPIQRDFGFRDQIRRASVSTMSNTAEAFGRSTDADKARLLDIARGSANETLSLLILARDIGHLTHEEFAQLETSNRKALAQLTALIKYLRS